MSRYGKSDERCFLTGVDVEFRQPQGREYRYCKRREEKEPTDPAIAPREAVQQLVEKAEQHHAGGNAETDYVG